MRGLPQPPFAATARVSRVRAAVGDHVALTGQAHEAISLIFMLIALSSTSSAEHRPRGRPGRSAVHRRAQLPFSIHKATTQPRLCAGENSHAHCTQDGSRCKGFDGLGLGVIGGGLHRWEEQHLLDVVRVGHEHDQSVNTQAPTAGGRQAVFERRQETLVLEHGLVVASRLVLRTGAES